MKKKFMLLFALSVAITCSPQQAIHLGSGAIFSIQGNTELSLVGGITLESGSSLINNGIIRLKNNPVLNQSDWVDNSISGALSGTGLVIFNSAYSHSFSGLTDFYSLQVNAAGLTLNNDLIISNQLHLVEGKISTGTNQVSLNNNNASSLLNDVTNTGYVNCWIDGKFRRLITSNTSTYDFPVGNNSRSNLLQFVNNNITGTQHLTASFGNKPGTDDGLSVSEGEDPYIEVNSGGVWYLTPDAPLEGGDYALHLFFNGFNGLSDNQFGILKRADSSSNGADWMVPVGSLLEGLNGTGRKVSDGYARRFNLSEFSQWGIGQFQPALLTWYEDADGDTFGNADVTQQSSSQPSGYVSNAMDCDDTNAAVHPGAAEVCNGIDDDCDGLIDEDDPGITGQTAWYADVDNDGFGNPEITILACNQPAGYVSNSDDCNDADASVTVETIWYADNDGDGYGNPGITTAACNQPVGYVSNNEDCDDNNTLLTNGTAWYADADGDGYGNPGIMVLACSQPEGYVANGDDCNDAKGQIHPGAVEACNGIDDDCDGQVDEGCAIVSIYDAEVFESAGVVNLVVSLSMPVSQPVKISYKTLDGSAVSTGRNKDYKGVGNGNLTIPAGQTSGMISIVVYTDNLNEPDEFFDIQITKINNALPGDITGRVTIHDGAAIMTKAPIGEMMSPENTEFTVLAYPNPGRSHFNVYVMSGNPQEKIVLQVLDVQGRIIETKNVTASSKIQFGDLYQPGVYILRVIQGKQYKELKLVKIN